MTGCTPLLTQSRIKEAGVSYAAITPKAAINLRPFWALLMPTIG